MTNWTEALMDVAPLRAIFGDELPTLELIDLHEVILHRDGPRISLRFDLRQFPAHPPSKWKAADFNRVQLTLLISGIHALSIVGWQSQIRTTLTFLVEGKLIRLQADNGSVAIELTADFLMIEKISGYRDSGVEC